MKAPCTIACAEYYYLPNIILHDERGVNGEIVPLGRYGMLHKAYLREHKSALYSQLLLSERLYPLCREVDNSVWRSLQTENGHTRLFSPNCFTVRRENLCATFRR
jgi:hypothetical protein